MHRHATFAKAASTCSVKAMTVYNSKRSSPQVEKRISPLVHFGNGLSTVFKNTMHDAHVTLTVVATSCTEYYQYECVRQAIVAENECVSAIIRCIICYS